MRKIAVAFTAATLALSMLAQAIPAAAAAGYDSSYAGESAFVSLAPGQSNEFQVFFANTGTTTWTVGTSTEVDLAACLEDKTTCNAQDATEATWNAGWKSATTYATSTQTSVAPGSIATFKYTVTAPAGVAAGTYNFNGDLVVAAGGAKVHPEGYYQSATVGAGSGAAVITSLAPATGTANGGTPVTINGTGFVCTPAFPSVTFGSNTAAVTSCGTTALTVNSPAGAVGAATVQVTNSGAAASNGLTYTYSDTTHPVFNSFTVSANLLTVTFSEPVCRDALFAATDWTVNNVSGATTNAVMSDSIPACSATTTRDGVSTATLQLTTVMPNGAFVETTLNGPLGAQPTDSHIVNANIADAAVNGALAPQSRQATATPPETTAPTITTITGAVGASSITINFSEPVYCAGFNPSTMIAITDNNTATTNDPTATGATPTGCGAGSTTADSSFTVTLGSTLPADRTYAVTVTPGGTIKDIVGNNMATQTVNFTTGAGDFTPPTIVDARMANNVATTDFTETLDSFTATFSEKMNGTTTGTIQIQDQDGTVFTLNCGGNISCSWNTAVTTVTVTLTTTIVPPVVGQPGAGSTPGMQIPFNITTLNGFADLQGNVPNVLGSADRLVDYE